MRATLIPIVAITLAPAMASAGAVYAQAQVVAPGAPPPGAWRGSPMAPPAPRVERVRPRRGFVWIQGNYQWRGGRYVWMPGHWERERAGQRWHGGRWEWQRDHYVWIQGYWTAEPAYVPAPAAPVVAQPQPPPPPPQQPVAVPAPRPGFVWIAGHQEWRDGRYVWEEGHWERERPGERWEAGHWDGAGDRHYWHPSGWHHGEGGRAPAGPISIAGAVIDRHGRPVPGVTVTLAGSSEARAVTDGNGRYGFAGLVPGSYSVRPTDGRCRFQPDVANLNNLASATAQDFSAACGW